MEKERPIKVKERFFNAHRTSQLVGLVLCVAATSFALGFSSGYKTAISVTYNGRFLGYVSSTEEALKIEESVRADAKRKGTADINFEYSEQVVNKNEISDLKKVTKDAIECTVIVDPHFEVAALYINGEMKVVADNEQILEKALDDLVAKYAVNGAVFDGFGTATAIKTEIIKESDNCTFVNCMQDLIDAGAAPDVLTHGTKEYDETISYKTTYKYDSSKDTSYKETVKQGVNGSKHVIAEVSYVNGEEVSREVVSSTVTKEAVNAEVVKGTKEKNTSFQGIKDRLDAKNAQNDGSKLTFIFPLEIRSAGYISSYWGDGRGHKGMDFATPKGTDIYAVADGVVTISTYSSSYGYYIEIKHKDGTLTRYAHASKLLVSVGDTVKQGEHIAEVGSTGRSTGNHLHFEVWKNGTRVNPASYLSIN